MKDYYISIFYSEEDEAYVADVPDLPYCSALGQDPEEALREVLIAKEAWLESARANNKEVPLLVSNRSIIKLFSLCLSFLGL